MNNFYIGISQVFKNTEDVKRELEFWINEKIEFLKLWEKIYNEDDIIEPDEDESLTIESWCDRNVVSIYIHDDEIFFHPQILIAFIIDEPIYRINLLHSIFSLNQEDISKILKQTFEIENQDNINII